MRHPAEDQLMLHHYGEGDRVALDRHLAACPECRARYDALRRFLSAVTQPAPPPRDDGYGERVWRRVQGRAARPEPTSRLAWLRTPRLVLVGSVAAMLVLAFLAGRLWPAQPAAAPLTETVRERILLVAVGDHLEQSQRLLVELVNAPGASAVDISAERDRAALLASRNRVYRQTARRAGAADVARLLEDLERILLEVATRPSVLAGEELVGLRRQIEQRGILFRMRVLGERSRQEGRPPTPDADDV